MSLFYADASALMKLVREESESPALRAYLEDAGVVSSELILAELPRAAHRVAAQDSEFQLGPLLERTYEVIEGVALRPIDRTSLTGAGSLDAPTLRTLDAIHVVSALAAYPIDAFVTYDERQAAAARLAGLHTVAPGLSD
jgi:uncharacterized protein